MDEQQISLIRELNKPTVRKTEFENALDESGYELPDGDFEDEIGGELDHLGGDKEVDAVDDIGYNDGGLDVDASDGLDEEEIQDIVDWCQEECGDMSDDELMDTLKDELTELELSPEELDDTVERVMTSLGRGAEEEIGDEYGDEEMDEPEMGGGVSLELDTGEEEMEY